MLWQGPVTKAVPPCHTLLVLYQTLNGTVLKLAHFREGRKGQMGFGVQSMGMASCKLFGFKQIAAELVALFKCISYLNTAQGQQGHIHSCIQ